MEDSLARQLSHLMPVHDLKRREAANIKRLEEVRGVSWHAEGDDLVLFTELIKLWRSVAAVPINDEESIRS
jgi:hypothetical protein